MMRRSVKREFFGNVIPSMIAFAFTGVYAIVDGFFVGRNVGDAGLAAINVAYPLVALIQAAGTGLGMAGAIQIAINKGKKDEETERRYLGNAFVLLLLAGILLTGLLLMFYPVILRLFGASGEIYTYGHPGVQHRHDAHHPQLRRGCDGHGGYGGRVCDQHYL